MKEQTSPRILVVDDDESVRKTTVAFILKMGYPCDAVSSGEEALERLQREHFDIVVSDIAMEGMNGLEFMKRAKERFPQLDFIIMTGYAAEYSYSHIIKAGAVDYLAKPFERAELQARLKRATRKRRLLCQLKESEKRYSALVESSPDIIYTLDPEGKFSFIGGAMEKLLGFSSEELVGKHFTSVVYPEDIEKAHWHLNEQKTREQPSKRFELRFKTKEGETKSFEVYCMVMDLSTFGNCDQSINVKDETFPGTYGVARDVTQRKWAEEALLESHDELERTLSELKETQEYISNIFQGAGDAMRVIDKDFNILQANIEMDRLAGMPIGESVGKKCYEILRGESCDTDKCSLRQVLAGEKRVDIESMEKTGCGGKVYVRVVSSPLIQNGEVAGVIESIRDISERKKAEEALRKSHDELEQTLRKLKETQTQMLQSEKMASIGQLAAGVAHEINNPTGFISSNLHNLASYEKDLRALIDQYRGLISELNEAMATEGGRASISEKLGRITALGKDIDIDFILDDIPNLMKECREGCEQIKKIVLNLKDFAHPGEDELSFADINKGLDSTLNVAWNELKYKATVTKDYGDLPEVQCYPHQLNQVFLNLLVNAAQAIEQQGEVKIRTSALDGKVEIKISDTGGGIPEENLSKIFDPFFTTKEVGKGTGLGLNVAYNIVKKHKGVIDVESTLGKGTTFTIRIPTGETSA